MKKTVSIIILAGVAAVSFVWAVSAPGLQWLCGGISLLASVTMLCDTVRDGARQSRPKSP